MEIEDIKRIANDYGLTPSKSKGQNFLLNEEIVKNTVLASGIGPDSGVLEVGAGFGMLTKELMVTAKKVLVVELDPRAVNYLTRKIANEKLEIIPGDILRVKNSEIAEKLGGKYDVVANIPYNITSFLIRKFLTYDPKPESMTLLVQDEVAKRIAAEPGDMSLLAISVQLYADAQYQFKVGKANFWPQPQVESAVIKITLNDKNLKKLKVTENQFFQLVKFGFSSKRKKLANNLGAGLRKKPAEMLPIMESMQIGINARAQELSMDQWIGLANVIFGE